MWYAVDAEGNILGVSLMKRKEEAVRNFHCRWVNENLSLYSEWEKSLFAVREFNPLSKGDEWFKEYVGNIREKNEKKQLHLEGDVFKNVWEGEKLRKNFKVVGKSKWGNR